MWTCLVLCRRWGIVPIRFSVNETSTLINYSDVHVNFNKTAIYTYRNALNAAGLLLLIIGANFSVNR